MGKTYFLPFLQPSLIGGGGGSLRQRRSWKKEQATEVEDKDKRHVFSHLLSLPKAEKYKIISVVFYGK